MRHPYPRDMTERLESDVATLIADLDAISDPAVRFHATVTIEALIDEELRKVRQRIAAQLRGMGLTFREIGEVMGGVTLQRAEQVLKGR